MVVGPARGELARQERRPLHGLVGRKTTTPILLIGTRYDPNTSYRNAVRSQLLLGDAVLAHP